MQKSEKIVKLDKKVKKDKIVKENKKFNRSLITNYYLILGRWPSALRKTNWQLNSLAHRTTWLRSDLNENFLYVQSGEENM